MDRHERTPALSTNQRVLYPLATLVYLLRYPFKLGSSKEGASINVVSWLTTAENEMACGLTDLKKAYTVLGRL